MRFSLIKEMEVFRLPHRRVLLMVVTCLCFIAIAGVVALAASADPQHVLSDIMSRRDHQAIVDALEDQITIIKWIGGGIVTSLVASVGFLYRSLERANHQSRKDLIAGIHRREELVEEVVRSNTQVITEVSEMSEDMKAFIQEIRIREKRSA